MFPIAMSDMWSLGKFRPKNWDNFRDEMDVWLRRRVAGTIETGDYEPNKIHVRSPYHKWSMANSSEIDNDGVHMFHSDGAPFGHFNQMIVWSNDAPTEITRNNKGAEIWQAAPFEVLVFDNMKFLHRTPPRDGRTDWSNRWFARTFISDDATIKDVRGVFALETDAYGYRVPGDVEVR